MNVDVILFQLRYVNLPDLIVQKLLGIAIQNQTNVLEQYIQQSTVIRQETLSLAQKIIANATVISQTATAQASYIESNANAEAFRIVQDAKKSGYSKLFEALQLNTTELQLAFLYSTSLQDKTDAKLLVNLGSVIIQN
jgi:hypothetical protein